MRILLILAALSLGSALAQTTAPVGPVPTPTSLPGQIPDPVRDLWVTFTASGGQANLISESGAVIGVINPDGTVSLMGEAPLSDIKTVQMIRADGQVTTVNVTRDLSRPGAVKIEFTDARGRMQSLPLPAVVRRLEQMQRAEQPGVVKSGTPKNPETPKKPETPKPGNGKGR